MSVLFQVKKFIIRPCNIGYTMLIINMFHMVFQLASNQHVCRLQPHMTQIRNTSDMPYCITEKYINFLLP